MNKAYLLFVNEFYSLKIIDKTLISYLFFELKKLGFNHFVGVFSNTSIEKEDYSYLNEVLDVDNISLKNNDEDISIVIPNNCFIYDYKRLENYIEELKNGTKKYQILVKKTKKYHSKYGILKNDRVILLKNEYLSNCTFKEIMSLKRNKRHFDNFEFINNLYDLNVVRKLYQKRIIDKLIEKNVMIANPETNIISSDCIIEENAIIETGTIIYGNSIIKKDSVIGPYSKIVNSIIEEEVTCSYSVIEDSIIKRRAKVGPFTHLRSNTVIGEENRVGNFVEIKNSTLGKKTNVAHLTYIGDTTCGSEVNFGCGCVTVNYDGKNKYPTIIGDKVFIGCNSNLIAPIKIESKSFIAAGSTITNNLDKGSFAIARAKQVTKMNYAQKYKFKEGVKSMLKVIKCKDYEEASKVASEIFINAIKENPNITLGLATGSTPIGTYKNLIKAYKEGMISFKDVKTYNLDEYVGLPLEHPETYYNFMHTNLFNHVDINEDNVHVPYADKENMEESCKKYSEMLNNTKVDIQLLGIGANGHIGFNEPGTSFDQETFIVELTQKTREDNKRFFNSIDEVPTHAITMGIKNIMNAKKVVLVATGANKQEAVKMLLSKEITTSFPASVLHKHDDVVVIIDEEAGKLL